MALHPVSTHAAARRILILALATVLAGSLLGDPLAAQQIAPVPIEDSGAAPFTDNYNAVFGSRDLAFRLNYDTERYGQQNGQFGIGVQGHRPFDGGLWIVNAQYNLDFGRTERMGFDVGGGLRVLYPDLLGRGEMRIFGAQLWYDGLETDIENFFNQLGFSLESLGDRYDVRINGNFPIGRQTQAGAPTPLWNPDGSPRLNFTGQYLTQLADVPVDEAMSVVEFEVAGRVADYDAWLFAGGYGLDASGDTCFGGKVGARGWIGNDALLELALTQDDFFDTKVNFAVVWYPGRSGLFSPRSRCLDDRLRDPVLRNDYIATRRVHEEGGVGPLTDVNGTPLAIIHVYNPTGAEPVGGDGTAEDPYTSLTSVYANSDILPNNGEIILVHGGSIQNGTAGTPESIQLRNRQRLLGEGDGVEHRVTTLQFGEVILPETRPGAGSGPKPVINNVTGDVVRLATAETTINTQAVGYDPDLPRSYNEVSNLSIVGGTRGIVSSEAVNPNPGANGDLVGIGQVDITHMDIAATTGSGIKLTPFTTFDVDNGGNPTGRRVIFRPTIENVTFDGVGTAGSGDDILLDASTSQPGTTTVDESINIENVASTDAYGWGINIINNKSQALISDYTFNAGANSNGGILFDSSEAGAQISDATIAGNSTSTGDGVKLAGAAGQTVTNTFTFADTTISDMGGAGMHVMGDAANVNFTGLITQDQNVGAAVLVEGDADGGHTGTLNFNEMVANQGVILATAGPGLTFENADGTYRFNNLVSVTGGVATGATAGISITEEAGSGSDGDFTFSNVALTNINGTAFNLSGGTASVNFTGKITQSTNSTVAAMTIGGGHREGTAADEGSGTVTFTERTAGAGIVTASDGLGLQFNNADGTYLFSNAIQLTDAVGDALNSGIGITGGSDGAFTFSDATITNIDGAAFSLNGGTAGVTFTGKITQTAKNAAAVVLGGGHQAGAGAGQGTGIVAFNEKTGSAGVIEATTGAGIDADNADGTYNFNHAVALSGAAHVDINGSDGAFKFSNATVTNSTATALNIVSGDADVNFTGLITANAATALNVSGGHTGSLTMTERTANEGIIVATGGPGITFNQADGTYTLTDKITLSGGATVSIVNSDGTITMSDSTSTINNTAAGTTAFHVDGGNAAIVYGGKIASSASGRPVEIENVTGGTVTLSNEVTSTGNGIWIHDNDNGTFNFNGHVTLTNTADTGVLIQDIGSNNSDLSTIRFDNLDIVTTGQRGFDASGGGILVGGGGTLSSITTIGNTALRIDGMEIGASGLAFQDVSDAGGAAVVSGIILSNVTGSGTLTINDGTIQNTTSHGIDITNVAHVSLNNMNITDVGTSAGDGISLTHNNNAVFNVTINDCAINNTPNGDGVHLEASGTAAMHLTMDGNTITQSNAGQQAVQLNVNAGAGNTYIAMTGNSVSQTAAEADDQQALLLNVAGGTCYFQATGGNTFTSSDTTTASYDATQDGASFDANVTGGALNAIIRGNTFNSDATAATARGFRMAAVGGPVRLSLLDNLGSSDGDPAPFLLYKNGGSSFGVELLQTPAAQGDTPKQDEVNKRNGGSGEYADYAAPNLTPEEAGWRIEFLPDAAPLTPPITLGFGNLPEGTVQPQ